MERTGKLDRRQSPTRLMVSAIVRLGWAGVNGRALISRDMMAG